MFERLYSEENVPLVLRPIFKQLTSTYPKYEIWERWKNYGRILSAGVVNRTTGVAATIPLIHRAGTRIRPVSTDEVFKISARLSTAGADDITLASQ